MQITATQQRSPLNQTKTNTMFLQLPRYKPATRGQKLQANGELQLEHIQQPQGQDIVANNMSEDQEHKSIYAVQMKQQSGHQSILATYISRNSNETSMNEQSSIHNVNQENNQVGYEIQGILDNLTDTFNQILNPGQQQLQQTYSHPNQYYPGQPDISFHDNYSSTIFKTSVHQQPLNEANHLSLYQQSTTNLEYSYANPPPIEKMGYSVTTSSAFPPEGSYIILPQAPQDFAKLIESDVHQLLATRNGGSMTKIPRYKPVESIIQVARQQQQESNLLASSLNCNINNRLKHTQISFDHSSPRKYRYGVVGDKVELQKLFKEGHECIEELEESEIENIYRQTLVDTSKHPSEHELFVKSLQQSGLENIEENFKVAGGKLEPNDVSAIAKPGAGRRESESFNAITGQRIEQNSIKLEAGEQKYNENEPDVDLGSSVGARKANLTDSEVDRQQKVLLANNTEISNQDYELQPITIENLEKQVDEIEAIHEVLNEEERYNQDPEVQILKQKEKQQIEASEREELERLRKIDEKRLEEIEKMRHQLQSRQDHLQEILIQQSPILKPQNLIRIENLEKQLLMRSKQQISRANKQPSDEDNSGIEQKIRQVQQNLKNAKKQTNNDDNIVSEIEEIHRQQSRDKNRQLLYQAEHNLLSTMNDVVINRGILFEKKLLSPPRNLSIMDDVKHSFTEEYEIRRKERLQYSQQMLNSSQSDASKNLYQQLENGTPDLQHIQKQSSNLASSHVTPQANAKVIYGSNANKQNILNEPNKRQEVQQKYEQLALQAQSDRVPEDLLEVDHDPIAIKRSYVKNHAFKQPHRQASDLIAQTYPRNANIYQQEDDSQLLYQKSRAYSQELQKGLKDLKSELSSDSQLPSPVVQNKNVIDYQGKTAQKVLMQKPLPPPAAPTSQKRSIIQVPVAQKPQTPPQPKQESHSSRKYGRYQISKSGVQEPEQLVIDPVEADFNESNATERLESVGQMANLVTLDTIANVDRSHLDVQSSRLEDDKIISESPGSFQAQKISDRPVLSQNSHNKIASSRPQNVVTQQRPRPQINVQQEKLRQQQAKVEAEKRKAAEIFEDFADLKADKQRQYAKLLDRADALPATAAKPFSRNASMLSRPSGISSRFSYESAGHPAPFQPYPYKPNAFVRSNTDSFASDGRNQVQQPSTAQAPPTAVRKYRK